MTSGEGFYKNKEREKERKVEFLELSPGSLGQLKRGGRDRLLKPNQRQTLTAPRCLLSCFLGKRETGGA